MKFSIKHRFSGSVLFELECGSLKPYLDGANLASANLDGALKIEKEEIPIVPNIDAAILSAIESGGTLDMTNWHGPNEHWCGTAHCRAGWAIHLAGEKGRALEDKAGPLMAGTLIYHASRPGTPAPNFFASTDVALADIRKCAAVSACTVTDGGNDVLARD